MKAAKTHVHKSYWRQGLMMPLPISGVCVVCLTPFGKLEAQNRTFKLNCLSPSKLASKSSAFCGAMDG